MRLFLLSIVFCLSFNAFAQDVTFDIEITNLRNKDGNVLISVYKDQQSFDDEKPAFTKKIVKKDLINNGVIKAKLSLPEGTYALAMLDDENLNGEMDSNWIGMPKEGFGFSNYIFEKLRKPTFEEFRVALNSNTPKVTFKVKYM